MDEQQQKRIAVLHQVERRLVVVLRKAAGWLPQEQLAFMESAADHGEPGVAFENFCTQIYEYDVQVPEAMVHELAELAAMMEMTLPPWIGNPDWAPPIN